MRTVSIHAPARGATTHCAEIAALMLCFNPRAREGRDLPRGSIPPLPIRFNPRAREGRDFNRPYWQRVDDVSIHAPARGATLAALQSGFRYYRFNPRAREGRDP